MDTLTDLERTRQRVAFGYEALGLLLGRRSDGTPPAVVDAWRHPRHDAILLAGLPRRASWVELRTGDRVERLPIRRIERGVERGDDPADEGLAPALEGYTEFAAGDDKQRWAIVGRAHASRFGVVVPEVFTRSVAVGSLVCLDGARGPVVGFGPRLPALATPDRPY